MELSGYEFGRVCDVDPDRTDAGVPRVVVPQPEYAKRDEKPVHDHGWGPFCAFGIPDEGTHRPGVYVLAVEGEVTYVGETQDLYAKFANGYGTISPADCFEGGGGTNCRLNTAIFHAVRAGDRVSVHLHATDDFAGTADENRALRRIIKDDLVTALNPAWNRTGGDDRADEREDAERGEADAPEVTQESVESESDPGSETEPNARAGTESGPDGDGADAEPDPVGAAMPNTGSSGGVSSNRNSAGTVEEWFETERRASGRSEAERSDPERPDPNASRPAEFDAAAPDSTAPAAEGFEPKPVEPERSRDARSAPPAADRPTGEFAALYDYLVEHERDRVERSFADLEVVLDARLPTEARRWRRWWTNDESSHPHASAWLRAGYEVTEASLPEGRVAFERVGTDERSQSAPESESESGSVASPSAGRASPQRPE
ncbi:GIY-YIG nuclease family protein [Halogeometricum sp. S1BR25-6]|uniref:GIY-YIG nuclease family protein n=1 Tax=Halogeometricum salsisoli TaxID=2950536 RepID=A0ABU2GH21_9EURY|nr:GIY-YIG nuclease family protein [Halogeometricum sp. S1BR25-6]MDS0299563.1 GIY-YIG nuclease family protein [Halogeometricum sp. S1BR25-6]